MRGKVLTPSRGEFPPRITPAYAGKSLISSSISDSLWDHPRLCGEKQMPSIRSQSPLGSPPPMRGKASSAADDSKKVGITPAYAGKSLISSSISDSLWDHPRLCGEKQMPSIRSQSPLGSPPPMRGKASSAADDSKKVGITPAYAGKRH